MTHFLMSTYFEKEAYHFGKWKISITFCEQLITLKCNENKAVLLNSSYVVLPIKTQPKLYPPFIKRYNR